MQVLNTPLGKVAVDASGRVVRGVHLNVRGTPSPPATPLAKDLERYFRGEDVDFSKYEVELSRRTEFERAVYAATRMIPRGKVATYGQLAKAVGRPGAARAVGNAMSNNPACIVIPCHRVVSSDGLGGWSGDFEWKKRLLRLEGALR